MARYTAVTEASTDAIDRIQTLLKAMQHKLDQEKADHGKHNWADVGTLNEVARQLTETNDFWMGLEAE